MEPRSTTGTRDAADGRPPEDLPAAFAEALAALAGVRPRPEIELEPIPAPKRLAPHASALAAHVVDPEGDEDDDALADARFIVLHDPAGVEAWAGSTRCVGYLRAATDEQMVDDQMFSEVAWSWLTDALVDNGASHHAVGGTVTRTASTRFGSLAGPEHSVEVEIRASWSAGDTALDRHLSAWLDVVGTAAGLPPEGVQLLGPTGRVGGSS